MSVDQVRAGTPTPHDPVAQQEIAHEQAFVDRSTSSSRVGQERRRRWPARATAAAGSATRAAWSSATRWSSRPPSGSPSSTPPTRAWSSAASTCAPTLDPRAALHRPDRRCATSDRDSLLIDWRAPGGRRVLPGHRRRAAGRRTPPGAALRRRRTVVGVEDELLDAERRDRPADRRRGRADGAAVAGPRPVDALDRRDHPGRAGPGDPGARQGRRVDLRRPGHRQDGRRAAPRGVPALHRPPPLRDAAACWSSARQRRLHALHRAGAAVASARPRSRCARWARSSTACARPATTSRRSPTSRARPGWPS